MEDSKQYYWFSIGNIVHRAILCADLYYPNVIAPGQFIPDLRI